MLQINPEFKKLIPALTAEEFQQLEANCLAEGIRDAIVVWNGFIIDGHNRYEIANKHGLQYRTVEMHFESETYVKIWMIYNQFGRRNLNAWQRSVLALELEEVFKEKAKENLILSGKLFGELHNKANIIESDMQEGWQKSANPLGKQLPKIEPMETRKELAKFANVSHDTISKVKVIEAKATPEVKAQLSAGDMSINQAYKEIKQEEKIKERVELIEKQKKEIAEENLPVLVGKYTVISVDPPWPYGREYNPETSRVANPYPEMSIDEIKGIDLPFKEDAILFLWTTHMFLPYAFEIVKHWGFDYKSTLVWDKQKIGMGAWFRMQCEFCIFAIKGKPNYYNTTERDLISEARREHSRKPNAFFEMVDKICIGRKLEYFSREQRNGWDIFGNDTEKF